MGTAWMSVGLNGWHVHKSGIVYLKILTELQMGLKVYIFKNSLKDGENF